MPTALITGVAGQDGSYLAESLLADGYRVVGTVAVGGARSMANLAHVASRLELIELDLGDASAIDAAVERVAPDELYNLAAMSFSPDCWDHPHRAGRILGLDVVLLLEAVRTRRPGCRVFQAGSSEMFGPLAEPPQSERTPLRPASPYAAAKAYAHAMTQVFRERHGLYAVNGILFPHESPRRDPRFLTRKVAMAAARIARDGGGEVMLGNLDARRDWSFAGDVADGMRRSLRADRPGDYVFASGEARPVRDFCAAAFARVGLDYRDHVRVDPRLVRNESGVVVGDAGTAERELGWRRRTSFEDLVAMMVDAERARAAGPPRENTP